MVRHPAILLLPLLVGLIVLLSAMPAPVLGAALPETPDEPFVPGATCRAPAVGEIIDVPWTMNPPQLDGRPTDTLEWTDALCLDLTMVEQGGSRTIPARWFFKNDGQWLYLLVRVAKSDHAVFGEASISYFWPYPYDNGWQQADKGAAHPNYIWDGFGWDETRWYSDVGADPPGTADVEGAVLDDGQTYWYEFKKRINSDDPHDWPVKPGHLFGTDLTGNLDLGINDWNGSSFSIHYRHQAMLRLSHWESFDCSTVTEIPQSECQALVNVYNKTGGPNWIDRTGWLQTNTPCSWTGVRCYGGSYVGELRLPANGLQGKIPEDLTGLTGLRELDLSYNSLPGEFPSFLTSFTQLSDLHLNDIGLRGPLPADLGNMAELRWFFARWNQLTGPIPDSVGQLTELRQFSVDHNFLSGPLPESLASLATNLYKLSVERNPLSGALPASFAQLANLDALFARYTGICMPGDPALQAWVAGLEEGYVSDLACDDPLPATVTGRVVKSGRWILSGAAIAGVQVCAWDFDDSEYRGCVYTGADGSFILGGIPAGQMRIKASLDTDRPVKAGDYAPVLYPAAHRWHKAEPLDVFAGQTTDIQLAMDPGGVLQGTVYAADGVTPLAGIGVEVNGWGMGGCTDEEGRFFFTVPHGEYKLFAGADYCGEHGYAMEWWPNADSESAGRSFVIDVSNRQPADFTFTLAKPTTTAVEDPAAGAVLTHTDGDGGGATVTVPPGAVSAPVMLSYLPRQTQPANFGFQVAGRRFSISASREGETLPTLLFDQPVDLTLSYTDADVAGMDENDLVIQYWDEADSRWRDAACGAYVREPDQNRISAPICHLTEFALFAPASLEETYLPLTNR